MLNERDNEDAAARLKAGLEIGELLGAEGAGERVELAGDRVFDVGEFEQAISAGREGLRIAKEIGSDEGIMRAYINGSHAIEDAGNLEEALALGVERTSRVRRPARYPRTGSLETSCDARPRGACSGWVAMRRRSGSVSEALERATTRRSTSPRGALHGRPARAGARRHRTLE